MRDQFAQQDDRFIQMSIQAAGLLLDYSKNRLDSKALQLLLNLAEARDLKGWINRLQAADELGLGPSGHALHTLLRNPQKAEFFIDGKNIMPSIRQNLQRMQQFSEAVQQGRWLGFSGKRITDVVVIGSGSAYAAANMLYQALQDYRLDVPAIHFISTEPDKSLSHLLKSLQPSGTLFMLAGEFRRDSPVMQEAVRARNWLSQHFSGNKVLMQHFVAITADAQAVADFALPGRNIFLLDDFLDSRHALWSSMGLPLVMALGMPHFSSLLDGAHAMDQHFFHAELSENMPVIMALLGVWYRNILSLDNHVVIPVQARLSAFSRHLQQLLIIA
ncbi:MAG: hypothetical protein KZQ58_00280 [gamma proteobacterium symbiont of Bathyaustriella thionipta]|nr:hypothetical protein [gamma proteobacterium symbiont of Bathyaustriella thionipta]